MALPPLPLPWLPPLQPCAANPSMRPLRRPRGVRERRAGHGGARVHPLQGHDRRSERSTGALLPGLEDLTGGGSGAADTSVGRLLASVAATLAQPAPAAPPAASSTEDAAAAAARREAAERFFDAAIAPIYPDLARPPPPPPPPPPPRARARACCSGNGARVCWWGPGGICGAPRARAGLRAAASRAHLWELPSFFPRPPPRWLRQQKPISQRPLCPHPHLPPPLPLPVEPRSHWISPVSSPPLSSPRGS